MMRAFEWLYDFFDEDVLFATFMTIMGLVFLGFAVALVIVSKGIVLIPITIIAGVAYAFYRVDKKRGKVEWYD